MPLCLPSSLCHFSVGGWARLVSLLLVSTALQDARAQSSPVANLAEGEAGRRARLVSEAEAQTREGYLLLNAGKYKEAAEILNSAYGSLPVSPLTAVARDQARRGYAAAACARTRQLLAEGRYAEAESLLDAVLKPDVDPQNKEALRLRKEMADPDRYPPALTPQHVAATKEVMDLLLYANSKMELGDYDAAIATYSQVLRIDRYNSAARRGMERAEQHKARYYETARDHQRSRMLNVVKGAWEDAIPPTRAELGAYADSRQDSLISAASNREKITQKLRTLMVPKVEFSGASFEEVIEFLRVRSRDLDPEGRGIDFVLGLPPETSSRPIDLSLTNIPLEELVRYTAEKAGATYKVEEFAVKFVSLSEQSGELFMKSYRVPPGFIEMSAASAPAAANPDPFAPGATQPAGGLSVRRLTAKEFLESRGVSFPDGATAAYNTSSNLLLVRNTATNHEIVGMLVDQAASSSPRQALISIKWMEINQNNLEELGFDWLLGQFNAMGSNGVFGSGGTGGNMQPADAPATNFPMLFPGTDVPVGQFPMTSGLRSSGEIIGRPTLNSLLGENLSTVPVNSRSPSQFAVAGVLTDPQFQVAVRALSQKKGGDVVAVPSIVAKSGQRASIDLAREFLYPTEFDPPEVPQQVGSVTVGNIRYNTGNNTAPITPSTPTTFEMRKLGVVIAMEPLIADNGREVELLITPEFTEFEGFIDYASDINNTIDMGGFTVSQPVDNRIIQPIFRTNRVNTSVRVYDGSTVVLAGVIEEKRTKVQDKVPIVGDIPLVGRFWKSRVDQSDKKNFVVFVSVRVLDPSGQPINAVAADVAPQPGL